MSILLLFTTACVGGGMLLGRFIARGAKSSAGDDGSSEGSTKSKTKPAVVAPPVDPFANFPCKLGDVVMRSGGDEAWLAGVVRFDEAPHLEADGGSEGRSIGGLFVAPEAKQDVFVYARVEGGSSLWWLRELAEGEVVLGADPPTSLEHGELRFERRRRLPVYAQRIGSGAPDVGAQVIVAEYGSGGYEHLLVVSGGGRARAYRGVALEAGMYEVIPSGSSTLDP